MNSLVGKWRVSDKTSKNVLSSSPLLAKHLLKETGKSSQGKARTLKSCTIDKQKNPVTDAEEIFVTFQLDDNGASLRLAFQPGVLNFESVSGQEISLCIVQNCSNELDEFNLIRLGPSPGQRSCETYRIRPNGRSMELNVTSCKPPRPRRDDDDSAGANSGSDRATGGTSESYSFGATGENSLERSYSYTPAHESDDSNLILSRGSFSAVASAALDDAGSAGVSDVTGDESVESLSKALFQSPDRSESFSSPKQPSSSSAAAPSSASSASVALASRPAVEYTSLTAEAADMRSSPSMGSRRSSASARKRPTTPRAGATPSGNTVDISKSGGKKGSTIASSGSRTPGSPFTKCARTMGWKQFDFQQIDAFADDGRSCSIEIIAALKINSASSVYARQQRSGVGSSGGSSESGFGLFASLSGLIGLGSMSSDSNAGSGSAEEAKERERERRRHLRKTLTKRDLIETVWVCEQLRKARKTLSVQQQEPQQQQRVGSVGISGGHDDLLDRIDLSSVPWFFGNKEARPEKIIQYVIEVGLNGESWLVTHRYNEFDVLRKFVLLQNPASQEIKSMSARFPAKRVFLEYRGSGLIENRAAGLAGFLRFFLKNSPQLDPLSKEAFCSFLQIPEHVGIVTDAPPTARKPVGDIPVSLLSALPSPLAPTASAVTEGQATIATDPALLTEGAPHQENKVVVAARDGEEGGDAGVNNEAGFDEDAGLMRPSEWQIFQQLHAQDDDEAIELDEEIDESEELDPVYSVLPEQPEITEIEKATETEKEGQKGMGENVEEQREGVLATEMAVGLAAEKATDMCRGSEDAKDEDEEGDAVPSSATTVASRSPQSLGEGSTVSSIDAGGMLAHTGSGTAATNSPSLQVPNSLEASPSDHFGPLGVLHPSHCGDREGDRDERRERGEAGEGVFGETILSSPVLAEFLDAHQEVRESISFSISRVSFTSKAAADEVEKEEVLKGGPTDATESEMGAVELVEQQDEEEKGEEAEKVEHRGDDEERAKAVETEEPQEQQQTLLLNVSTMALAPSEKDDDMDHLSSLPAPEQKKGKILNPVPATPVSGEAIEGEEMLNMSALTCSPFPYAESDDAEEVKHKQQQREQQQQDLPPSVFSGVSPLRASLKRQKSIVSPPLMGTPDSSLKQQQQEQQHREGSDSVVIASDIAGNAVTTTTDTATKAKASWEAASPAASQLISTPVTASSVSAGKPPASMSTGRVIAEQSVALEALDQQNHPRSTPRETSMLQRINSNSSNLGSKDHVLFRGSPLRRKRSSDANMSSAARLARELRIADTVPLEGSQAAQSSATQGESNAIAETGKEEENIISQTNREDSVGEVLEDSERKEEEDRERAVAAAATAAAESVPEAGAGTTSAPVAGKAVRWMALGERLQRENVAAAATSLHSSSPTAHTTSDSNSPHTPHTPYTPGTHQSTQSTVYSEAHSVDISAMSDLSDLLKTQQDSDSPLGRYSCVVNVHEIYDGDEEESENIYDENLLSKNIQQENEVVNRRRSSLAGAAVLSTGRDDDDAHKTPFKSRSTLDLSKGDDVEGDVEREAEGEGWEEEEMGGDRPHSGSHSMQVHDLYQGDEELNENIYDENLLNKSIRKENRRHSALSSRKLLHPRGSAFSDGVDEDGEEGVGEGAREKRRQHEGAEVFGIFDTYHDPSPTSVFPSRAPPSSASSSSSVVMLKDASACVSSASGNQQTTNTSLSVRRRTGSYDDPDFELRASVVVNVHEIYNGDEDEAENIYDENVAFARDVRREHSNYFPELERQAMDAIIEEKSSERGSFNSPISQENPVFSPNNINNLTKKSNNSSCKGRRASSVQDMMDKEARMLRNPMSPMKRGHSGRRASEPASPYISAAAAAAATAAGITVTATETHSSTRTTSLSSTGLFPVQDSEKECVLEEDFGDVPGSLRPLSARVDHHTIYSKLGEKRDQEEKRERGANKGGNKEEQRGEKEEEDDADFIPHTPSPMHVRENSARLARRLSTSAVANVAAPAPRSASSSIADCSQVKSSSDSAKILSSGTQQSPLSNNGQQHDALGSSKGVSASSATTPPTTTVGLGQQVYGDISPLSFLSPPPASMVIQENLVAEHPGMYKDPTPRKLPNYVIPERKSLNSCETIPESDMPEESELQRKMRQLGYASPIPSSAASARTPTSHCLQQQKNQQQEQQLIDSNTGEIVGNIVRSAKKKSTGKKNGSTGKKRQVRLKASSVVRYLGNDSAFESATGKSGEAETSKVNLRRTSTNPSDMPPIGGKGPDPEDPMFKTVQAILAKKHFSSPKTADLPDFLATEHPGMYRNEVTPKRAPNFIVIRRGKDRYLVEEEELLQQEELQLDMEGEEMDDGEGVPLSLPVEAERGEVEDLDREMEIESENLAALDTDGDRSVRGMRVNSDASAFSAAISPPLAGRGISGKLQHRPAETVDEERANALLLFEVEEGEEEEEEEEACRETENIPTADSDSGHTYRATPDVSPSRAIATLHATHVTAPSIPSPDERAPVPAGIPLTIATATATANASCDPTELSSPTAAAAATATPADQARHTDEATSVTAAGGVVGSSSSGKDFLSSVKKSVSFRNEDTVYAASNTPDTSLSTLNTVNTPNVDNTSFDATSVCASASLQSIGHLYGSGDRSDAGDSETAGASAKGFGTAVRSGKSGVEIEEEEHDLEGEAEQHVLEYSVDYAISEVSTDSIDAAPLTQPTDETHAEDRKGVEIDETGDGRSSSSGGTSSEGGAGHQEYSFVDEPSELLAGEQVVAAMLARNVGGSAAGEVLIEGGEEEEDHGLREHVQVISVVEREGESEGEERAQGGRTGGESARGEYDLEDLDLDDLVDEFVADEVTPKHAQNVAASPLVVSVQQTTDEDEEEERENKEQGEGALLDKSAISVRRGYPQDQMVSADHHEAESEGDKEDEEHKAQMGESQQETAEVIAGRILTEREGQERGTGIDGAEYRAMMRESGMDGDVSFTEDAEQDIGGDLNGGFGASGDLDRDGEGEGEEEEARVRSSMDLLRASISDVVASPDATLSPALGRLKESVQLLQLAVPATPDTAASIAQQAQDAAAVGNGTPLQGGRGRREVRDKADVGSGGGADSRVRENLNISAEYPYIFPTPAKSPEPLVCDADLREIRSDLQAEEHLSAQQVLKLLLRQDEGMVVIKHGRQGAPKRRVLQCDPSLTYLYWDEPTQTGKTGKKKPPSAVGAAKSRPKPDKMVKISDILEVRAGVEADPAASGSAFETMSGGSGFSGFSSGVQSTATFSAVSISASTSVPPAVRAPLKRRSTVGSLFSRRGSANDSATSAEAGAQKATAGTKKEGAEPEGGEVDLSSLLKIQQQQQLEHSKSIGSMQRRGSAGIFSVLRRGSSSHSNGPSSTLSASAAPSLNSSFTSHASGVGIGATSRGKLRRGTSILRRNIKRTEDLQLCFSLILPGRSLDIQCLSKAEYDVLYHSFLALTCKTSC